MLLSRAENNRSFGFVFIGRFLLSDWENRSAFADAASKHGDTRRTWSSVPCVRRSSLLMPNYESRQRQASDWQCSASVRRKTAASELRLIRLSLSEKIHPLLLTCTQMRGDTMNYTIYCRLTWPKKCIISVMCVFDNARWHPANAEATRSCPRSCDLS